MLAYGEYQNLATADAFACDVNVLMCDAQLSTAQTIPTSPNMRSRRECPARGQPWRTPTSPEVVLIKIPEVVALERSPLGDTGEHYSPAKDAPGTKFSEPADRLAVRHDLAGLGLDGARALRE